MAIFVLCLSTLSVSAQPGFPIREGAACGGALTGFFPACTVDGVQTQGDDGQIHFAPTTALESGWWIGPNHDAGGDNDDPLEFRQQSTPGSLVRLSLLPNGALITTGPIVTAFPGIEWSESDTLTSADCAAGQYKIWADTSEGKFKKCMNGVFTDMDTSLTGSVTLDSAFDNGKIIDGANSEANCARIGDGSSGFCIHGESGSAFLRGVGPSNSTLDLIFDPPAGKNIIFRGDGNEYERRASDGRHSYVGVARPYITKQWPAAAMFGHGVECNTDPTTETINGIPMPGIRCPMPGSEVNGSIYGIPWRLPENFVKGGGVIFELSAYVLTAATGTSFGRIYVDCVEPGEQPGTWGTGIALNLTPAAGDAVGDKVTDLSAASVDVDTTGANCDPTDDFYWRYQVCDTDTTPSGGCVSSSDGIEDNWSAYSMVISYRIDSESELP